MRLRYIPKSTLAYEPLENKRQKITEESTRDIEDTIRRLNIHLRGIQGGKKRKKEWSRDNIRRKHLRIFQI